MSYANMLNPPFVNEYVSEIVYNVVIAINTTVNIAQQFYNKVNCWSLLFMVTILINLLTRYGNRGEWKLHTTTTTTTILLLLLLLQ